MEHDEADPRRERARLLRDWERDVAKQFRHWDSVATRTSQAKRRAIDLGCPEGALSGEALKDARMEAWYAGGRKEFEDAWREFLKQPPPKQARAAFSGRRWPDGQEVAPEAVVLGLPEPSDQVEDVHSIETVRPEDAVAAITASHECVTRLLRAFKRGNPSAILAVLRVASTLDEVLPKTEAAQNAAEVLRTSAHRLPRGNAARLAATLSSALRIVSPGLVAARNRRGLRLVDLAVRSTLLEIRLAEAEAALRVGRAARRPTGPSPSGDWLGRFGGARRTLVRDAVRLQVRSALRQGATPEDLRRAVRFLGGKQGPGWPMKVSPWAAGVVGQMVGEDTGPRNLARVSKRLGLGRGGRTVQSLLRLAHRTRSTRSRSST